LSDVNAVPATAAAPARATPSGTPVRTDIQGLRAIAVSMVLLYHLWPGRMTGGFTGVDVFFVISGFLITAHLLAHPPRNARDLLTFWSRRIRRLLPASLLVLTATLIATRLLAPDTQWANTARQVKAAALYVVNWRLASDSVDYLAAENSPSPVQHFWSLSVEEQFYLLWPVLILILAAFAAWKRWAPWARRPIVLAGLGALVALSLGYSVYETGSNPSAAYFITTTRIWELGAGGLLAAALSRRALDSRRDSEAVRLPVPARVALGWLGLAAIAWTAFAYSGATPFPGYQALLPIAGTVAVIAALPPQCTGSPGPLLALRPVQWLGNVSYSVYLWHWPLIVLVPYASGDNFGRLDRIAVIVASLVLAGLTKRFVEDRFRTAAWGRPLIKPYALAAVGMALVVAGTSVQLAEVHRLERQATAQLRAALARHDPCFGAAAMAAATGSCPAATHGSLTPTPLQAATDKSDAYGTLSHPDTCFSYQPQYPVLTCGFGDPDSKVSVALVGNSHAGAWLPTVERIAQQQHWKVTTFLASRCSNADVAQQFDTPAYSHACRQWGREVTDRLVHGGFDLVVMTNRVQMPAVGHHSLAASQDAYRGGYQRVLATLSAAHVTVVGIRDTPFPGKLIPDCLAAHSSDYSRCDGPRAKWVPREPLIAATAAVGDPEITTVDLTDYFCRASVCPAVIGNVPVYFDNSHMTATFAATLAPYLAPSLLAAIRQN
jgi:peptidoglycan/LPS O-acetylase OafA/YrhL